MVPPIGLRGGTSAIMILQMLRNVNRKHIDKSSVYRYNLPTT
jgi:hypothetical protein